MSDQFLGEIRVVGFNFAPQGWAVCNGQLLPISQNTALFSLLGVNYGGNGTSTFALPNLQAGFPLDAGNGAGLSPYVVGESGGTAAVTLNQLQSPSHTHLAQASSQPGSTDSPAGAVWAVPHYGRASDQVYANGTTGLTPMAASALGTIGQNQPHNNLPPYLVLNFVIAMVGIYPPRP